MIKTFVRWVVCLCLCVSAGIGEALADNTTLDFSQITDFSKWGTGYGKHVVEYDAGTVTFVSANRQSNTITDVPVTKGNDVILVMADGNALTDLTLTCKQWSDKTQTITLHTSTDGGEYYTDSKVTSSDFVLSASSLPQGCNAVKFTFSSSSNQVGIASLAITYTTSNPRTAVNVTSASAGVETLLIGQQARITVANDQSGWTAAYTYTSDKESVATVSADGVITAVGEGTAKITVAPSVASSDETYKAGDSKSFSIRVEKPSHTASFSVNGQVIADKSVTVKEDETIALATIAENEIPEGQKFMGWTANAIAGTQQDKPTYVTNATMGTTDVTFYAVFATAQSSGEVGWQKRTIAEVMAISEPDTFAIITEKGYAFNGTISNNGHGQVTTEAFAFNASDFSANAPIGTQELIIKPVTNGIEIKKADADEYLYTTKNTSGGLSWQNSSNSYWRIQSSNLNYTEKNAYLRVYKGAPNSFRTYNNTSQANTAPVLFAQKIGTVTYSDYCTTVDGSDQRKYVNFEAWTAAGGVTSLVRGETLATNTSLSEAGCTSATFTYETSDASVATIAADGTITATGKGSATLTATMSIADDDAAYRAGNSVVRTLEITVVNPQHEVVFMANGTAISRELVREADALTFPAVTAPAGLEFVGWSTQTWDAIQWNAPQWADVENAVMADADAIYYAVFARVSQNGIGQESSLTAEVVQANFTQTKQAYGDAERTWTDGEITWRFKGQSVANGDYMQINSKNYSYVAFAASNNITRITFDIKNGSEKDFDGTVHVRQMPSEDNSVEDVKTVLVKGASADIEIEGNYRTLCIQTNNPAKIRNLTVTCLTPTQYAGYMTLAAAAQETRTFNVTTAQCGYTTICLPCNAVAPEGATFYALNSIESDALHFLSVDTLLAGHGYLVQGEANATYTLSEVTEPVMAHVNLLQGVVERTAVVSLGIGQGYNPWILAKDGSFKRYAGEFIPEGKAYIDGALLADVIGSGASALRVVFDAEEVAGVKTLRDATPSATTYYNLNGQRVVRPQGHGTLYIGRGDRKIIVK